MKDLTKGPLFKTLILFAVPIFFGNLFQLFYSLADTRIVGTYLGEQALAAVGGTSVLSNLLIGFMNGMTLGFAVPMARIYGGKKFDRLKKAFALAAGMGTLLCMVLVITCLTCMDSLMVFMKIEPQLMEDAKSYCTVLICGLFFTFAYNLGAATLRALGNSVTPLILLVCSSLLNVGLDIFFINNLHMGVFGAGLATVIAQGVSAILCVGYMLKNYEVLRFTRKDMKPEAALIRELLAAGCSMAFMSSLVQFGTLMLQTAINGLGQTIIVAHTAARKVTEIFMMAFSITGSAMCTFTGQNLGAEQYDRIRKGVFGALAFLACWVLMVIVLANTVAEELIQMITGSDNKEVLETGAKYLKFDTLFYMVAACITLFRNVLQGLGNHITPIVSSFVELAGKVVFAKMMVPELGYWGVILAEPVVWILMVIPLVVMLLRSPYLKESNNQNGRNG
ncbi:MAG: MATE family efflux transporter [Lachnospiraceae bacterium]|nr:MATE family efflux transporter [Lachnospiraceae bacterium]